MTIHDGHALLDVSRVQVLNTIKASQISATDTTSHQAAINVVPGTCLSFGQTENGHLDGTFRW